MYIKNISPSIFGDIPNKLMLTEGSIVFGKILFNDNSIGTIKLFDGTIIPAIFLSENNIAKDCYIKFKVDGYKDDKICLSIVSEEKIISESSINTISSKLSIPFKSGEEIIHSLIKFNLPATDENILTVHKNLEFINKAKNLSSDEILNFLKEKININIDSQSREFKIAQSILNTISEIDVDFLSFLIENQITPTINDVINLKDLMKNNFLYEELIDKNTLSETKPEGSENTSSTISVSYEIDDNGANKYESPHLNFDNRNINIERLLKKIPILKEQILKDFAYKFNIKELKIDSFEDHLEKVFSRDMFSDISAYRNTICKFQLIEHILENYSIYNFNTQILEKNFKNSIIIKNKYRGTRYLDTNNIKAFITVDAPSLGLIEGYIHKKNTELFILLKTKGACINIFKKHLDTLRTNLLRNGYSTVNISLEKIKTPNNLILLSNFFNDFGFQELDVKV